MYTISRHMPSKKAKASPPADGALSQLKSFYEFMTRNELDTLEIDEAGLHLRMVRRSTSQLRAPTSPCQQRSSSCRMIPSSESPAAIAYCAASGMNWSPI